jgi:hypothetical protein
MLFENPFFFQHTNCDGHLVKKDDGEIINFFFCFSGKVILLYYYYYDKFSIQILLLINLG